MKIVQRFNLDDLTFKSIKTEIFEGDDYRSAFGLTIFRDFSGLYAEMSNINKKVEIYEPEIEDVKEAVNYIFGIKLKG